MSHAAWHLVVEGAAAGVLLLWGAFLMARAPRPWSGSDDGTAALSRPPALAWAAVVVVVGIGFLVALFALTHGTHAHHL